MKVFGLITGLAALLSTIDGYAYQTSLHRGLSSHHERQVLNRVRVYNQVTPRHARMNNDNARLLAAARMAHGQAARTPLSAEEQKLFAEYERRVSSQRGQFSAQMRKLDSLQHQRQLMHQLGPVSRDPSRQVLSVDFVEHEIKKIKGRLDRPFQDCEVNYQVVSWVQAKLPMLDDRGVAKVLELLKDQDLYVMNTVEPTATGCLNNHVARHTIGEIIKTRKLPATSPAASGAIARLAYGTPSSAEISPGVQSSQLARDAYDLIKRSFIEIASKGNSPAARALMLKEMADAYIVDESYVPTSRRARHFAEEDEGKRAALMNDLVIRYAMTQAKTLDVRSMEMLAGALKPTRGAKAINFEGHPLTTEIQGNQTYGRMRLMASIRRPAPQPQIGGQYVRAYGRAY